MADRGENEGMAMDLSLNLCPAPPVVMGLELGSGSGSTAAPNNDEILIGEGSIRERVCPRIELLNLYRGFQDPQRSVQEVLNEEEEVLHELFGQPEQAGRYRSSQIRQRWRRHVRRIRPTILDSNPNPISPSRRSESSVSPLFVFRSVHTNGNGMGTVVEEPTIDNNATDNSNSERPTETLKQNLNRPHNNNDNININSSGAVQEADERSNSVSDFECNICLEMAREPVVTSCGHLFCWACLYRWLHVHSNTKECPVCKGEVIEMNITPIYGRGKGNADSAAEIESTIEGEQGDKIPPRPRAHRIEGLRQRMRIGRPRPISRRLAEAIRLWEESRAQNENRGVAGGDGDGHGDRREAAPRDDGVENLLGAAADQILNRLRNAHRLPREGLEDRWQMPRRRHLLRAESQSNTNAPQNATATSSHFGVEDRTRGRGDDNWEGQQEFIRLQRSTRARSERLAAVRAYDGMLDTWGAQSRNYTYDSQRLAAMRAYNDMFDTLAIRSRNYTNDSNATPPIGERRAQQPPALALTAVSEPRASTSSTNAVIQGSRSGDSMLEQESVRSPSPQRINGASGSLDVDVDGGSVHPRKRRRLN